MPSQERLSELFEYDPATGLLVRKIRTSNNAKVGVPLGCYDADGYLVVSVGSRHHTIQRVIWTLVHGPIPPKYVIDHINRIRDDNRLSNLRCVTHAENARNSKLSIRNRSGVTGVTKHRITDMWIAGICISGKKIYLGTYETQREATIARHAAEIALGFHSNHGRVVEFKAA